MDMLEALRASKQEGRRELERRQEEEQRRREEEAARARAAAEARDREQAERDRRAAERVFATLPALVRQAAERGLDAAVLLEGFVEERPPDGEPSLPLVVNRRTFHLKGWLIPFHALCAEAGIPLTVVSERVDMGLKRLVRRTYHVLAVDLRRL